MREQILKMLLSGEVRIIFLRRTDGLLRELLCTLNINDIPPEQYNTLSSTLQSTDDQKMVVWDIEKNDWRSFYFDSIVSVKMSEQKKQIEGQ